MAFPLSITGELTVRHSDLRSNQGAMERLQAALNAQTVDSITRGENSIEFIPQITGEDRKPRPEGGGWMFNALGTCLLSLRQSSEGLIVDYRLDCRLWFWTATSFSTAAGLIIWCTKGPDHQWAWAFALGFWSLLFMSGYLSKTIEFRRWLKNNLTSTELPPTKRLRVPVDPG
jgi:hypothetical protein